MDGKRLKKLRLSKRLSQQQLGKIIGVQNSAVSKYERNVLEPDHETLNNLATFFDVSVDYLLGRVDDPSVKVVPNKELPPDLANLIDHIEILKEYNVEDISAEEFKDIIEFAMRMKKKKE